MTRVQDLQAKADHFAVRADRARNRKARNTNLSLEQSYRNLAADEARSEATSQDPNAQTPGPPAARAG